MSVRFSGFSRETFRFLRDLESNNAKAWFEDNRERYREVVLKPAEAFIRALEGPMVRLDPPHKAVTGHNGSLRRMNRDLRFSKDKTPYTPRLHMIFWTGDHPAASPALHLVLRSNGVGFGAGQWRMSPKTLQHFRRALEIPERTAKLRKVMAKAESAGCQLAAPALKNQVKGYDAPDDLRDLLRQKALVFRTLQPLAVPNALHGLAAVDWFMSVARELVSMNRWLCDLPA